jgi:hypothetical protein
MALTEVTLALLVVDDPELRADLLGLRREGGTRADPKAIPDAPPAPAAA